MPRRRPFLALWLLASALWPVAADVSAQPYTAGQTYYGRNNYVEYRAGDLPVIITAGHGGNLTPSEIPDRTYGTTVTDTNTRQLAIACYDEIHARTGRRPHLILSHLNRIKLDPNREIVEAAQGNIYAEQAWNEFHAYVAAARDTARAADGFGFVVDIHGHGHDIARLELGYALGATELNVSDTALNNPGYAWMSTLRTLLLAHPGQSFPDLLRGPRSLGSLFIDRSVPAWPSSTYPSPGDAYFFDGGHIVRTHSCIIDNDTVHGVQIETHYTGVRDTASSRASFAATFCQVLQPYLYDNYGYSLGTLSLYALRAPATAPLARGGPALAVSVDRTGYKSFSSTLSLALGGTAVLGQDYTVSATSLAFASNQSAATFLVTPLAAGAASGDKTITIALAPNLKQSATPTTITLTLGDGVSESVRVEPVSASVSEADGAARFRLTRTRSTSTLSVGLAWSGSALVDADYFDAPATALFPAGVAEVEVAVPLVNDGRAGPDKTLVLTPSVPAPALLGYPASASVRLIDNDRPAGLEAWLRGDLAANVVADSSGHDRHATSLPADSALASGPAQGTAPSGAPAIEFDGADDTVALPKFTLDPEGAFSLAFFFCLDPGGAIAAKNIAAYGTRSAEGSLHLYLATTNSTNGTVALRTNLGGLAASALDVTMTSPATWLDGAWRHYALSVGADGSARVYIDGVLRRSALGRVGSLAADELLWLGWRPADGASTAFMDGALRDVRVYGRGLPAAEVSALAGARETFESWLSARRLSVTSSATEDPDGDGMSLFLEYGLSASPSASSGAPRYTIRASGDRLVLSFLRESSASDLAWIVEGTNSLAETWTTVARRSANDAAWTILSTGASALENNDHVVVTDSAPLSSSPRRFLRLRVERAP